MVDDFGGGWNHTGHGRQWTKESGGNGGLSFGGRGTGPARRSGDAGADGGLWCWGAGATGRGWKLRLRVGWPQPERVAVRRGDLVIAETVDAPGPRAEAPRQLDAPEDEGASRPEPWSQRQPPRVPVVQEAV